MKYSGTRAELQCVNDILNGKAIATDYELMQNLEEKLFLAGMDINPNSNLQAFHMAEAMAGLYSPQLAN